MCRTARIESETYHSVNVAGINSDNQKWRGSTEIPLQKHVKYQEFDPQILRCTMEHKARRV